MMLPAQPPVEVVDAQIHMWEVDGPDHPWDANFGTEDAAAAATRAHYTGRIVGDHATLTAMAVAGVDAALIVTPAIYGNDNSYGLSVVAGYPDRFRLIGRIDPITMDLEQKVAASHGSGLVGYRIVIANQDSYERLVGGYFDRLLAAAADFGVPICIYLPRRVAHVRDLSRRFPTLSITLDHLGLPQPPLVQPGEDAWESLPDVVALAEIPTVTVKLTAVPTMSSQPHPHTDLWPYLHRILRAFGPDRIMWGSDWTRPESPGTYREGVTYISETDELGPAEKALVLGGTLRHVFRWRKVVRQNGV